jgi:hypothetical protein
MAECSNVLINLRLNVSKPILCLSIAELGFNIIKGRRKYKRAEHGLNRMAALRPFDRLRVTDYGRGRIREFYVQLIIAMGEAPLFCFLSYLGFISNYLR